MIGATRNQRGPFLIVQLQRLQLGHGLQCWCQCCCPFSFEPVRCHPNPAQHPSPMHPSAAAPLSHRYAFNTQHTLHPSLPSIQPTHHSRAMFRCCSWVMACSAGASAAAPLAPRLLPTIRTPPNTHHHSHMIHTHHAPISCCSTQPLLRYRHRTNPSLPAI